MNGRKDTISLLVLIILGLSADSTAKTGSESIVEEAWFGEWGPKHWLTELCHWAGLCDNVCFGDLGCFSDELPCHKEFFPPMTPGEIGTRFTLHTRNRRADPVALNCTDVEGEWRREINRERKTIFIIHGWGEMDSKSWVVELKDALLDKDDVNVITVDWEEGADELNYMKSVQNVRVVGRAVGVTIQRLQTQEGLDPAMVHLIGHSLGAHAAGYAGKHVRGIGRITGLDAAGPAFENTDAACRLDRTDAMFVDVIHTSCNRLLEGGAGIEQRVGDMDFYPNGGRNQPGCKWWMIGCSHARSHSYFIQSVRDYCHFPAVPCETLADFRAGNCRSCGARGCPSMGYDAARNRRKAEGSFYLKTLRKTPYCSPKKYRNRDKYLKQGSGNDVINMHKGKPVVMRKNRQHIRG